MSWKDWQRNGIRAGAAFALACAVFCVSQPVRADAAVDCAADLSIWQPYSNGFQRQTKANIQKNAKHFEAALQRHDGHVEFLKAAGFKFRYERGRLAVDVPPLESVVNYVNSRVDKLIRDGRLKEDERMVLVRAFYDPQSKTGLQLTYVPVGEPVPNGLFPYTKLVKGAEYMRLLSEGKVLLGENWNGILGQRHSYLEHDLAHVSSFVDHPEYWRSILISYRRVLSEDTSNENRDRRIFYVVEALEIVPREKRFEYFALLDELGLHPADLQIDSPREANVLDFKVLLKDRSRYELYRIANRTLEEFGHLVERVGGASRDLMTPIGAKELGVLSLMTTPNGQADHLREELGKWRPNLTILRERIARLLTVLENLSRITPEEWVDQASRDRLKPGDSVYHFFCESGVYEPTYHYVARYFCQP